MCYSKQNCDWKKKKVLQCFIEVAETLQRTWAKSGRLTFISLNDSVPLVKVGWKVIECNKVLRTGVDS